IAVPVVVEIGVDLDPGAPGVDALGPLLELALRVVAVPTTIPVVEADEGPIGRQLMRLEGTFRVIADHERNAVRAQQLVDFRREPALVAELEAVAPCREPAERCAQAFVVPPKIAWELPQDWAQLRRADERVDSLVEALHSRPEVGEPLHVRQIPAGLDREHEALRRLLDPARDRIALRQPVERVVHLDGVEERRVVLEPPRLGQALWIDDLPPVGIVPARAADPDRFRRQRSARAARRAQVSRPPRPGNAPWRRAALRRAGPH